MSQALEGTPKPLITLTQQANGLRIPRSMFIGHTVGYLLVLAVAIGVLGYFGFAQPTSYDAVFAVTTPPTVIGVSRATGVIAPVRPTWMSMCSTVVKACSAGNLWAVAQRGLRERKPSRR